MLVLGGGAVSYERGTPAGWGVPGRGAHVLRGGGWAQPGECYLLSDESETPTGECRTHMGEC